MHKKSSMDNEIWSMSKALRNIPQGSGRSQGQDCREKSGSKVVREASSGRRREQRPREESSSCSQEEGKSKRLKKILRPKKVLTRTFLKGLIEDPEYLLYRKFFMYLLSICTLLPHITSLEKKVEPKSVLNVFGYKSSSLPFLSMDFGLLYL